MINEKFSMGSIVPLGTGVLGAETVSAAVAVHGEYLIGRRCTIKRIRFHVTTEIANDTIAAQVAFKKRPTPGSSTSSTTIGTLTLADATAVGKVVYKDVEPVVLNVGDSLCLEHTVQGTDGTLAAGAGYYSFELSDSPEALANESDLVASA